MRTRFRSPRFVVVASLTLALAAGCDNKPAVKPADKTTEKPAATGTAAPKIADAKPTATPTATPAASPAASPLTKPISDPFGDKPAAAASSPAVDAYVYGYSLMTMEYTRRVMTNVATPEGKLAPMGQFAHLRNYPSPSDKEVTAPNADTLYSLAWLDLAGDAVVFSIPDAKDRYYLMPMLDGFTNVFQVPGKRTTGTKPQKYLITGPKWTGTVPEGLTQYKSETDLVWILGRTYCNGSPEDYTEVHAFQDGLKLEPLASYGKAYTPAKGVVDASIDMKTAIREQLNKLDATAYFTLLAKLLKTNPPTAADAPIVATLAKVGIVPGQDFDASKVDSAVTKTFADAPKLAQAAILGHMKQAGTMVNGWTFSEKTGIYGTDYLQRSFITWVGLGANRPQDAVYPTAEIDGEGKTLEGKNKYTVHFDKGSLPPAKAFWSITMYDADYFFVPNALNRYTVSSRFPFQFNADGSLDLIVQHESPGKDKEANWLPAPSGKFILMLRLYWPEEAMLDGKWKVPPVVLVK